MFADLPGKQTHLPKKRAHLRKKTQNLRRTEISISDDCKTTYGQRALFDSVARHRRCSIVQTQYTAASVDSTRSDRTPTTAQHRIGRHVSRVSAFEYPSGC